MSKLTSGSFLTVLMAVSLLILSMGSFCGARATGTSISGIIAVDTTWTQANSPYTLIGNLLVNNGVTLTIQSGVIVNLGSYYLMVNGTLMAVGNYGNQITFNSNVYPSSSAGQIIFTATSNGYNSATSTGCIIQQATVNVPLAISNAVLLNQNTINNGINVQSQFNSPQTGIPTISWNNIKGGITIGGTGGGAIINNNNITGGTGVSFGSPNPPSVTVTGNIIYGCSTGIAVQCWGQSFSSPIQLITNNLVVNNFQGITLADWESSNYPTVRDNTITNNTAGVIVSYPWGNNSPILTGSITGNNIYGNWKYDFQNTQPTTVNAMNNWWGTTDTQTISRAIYDYYDDFKIGEVTYYPFLTAPNSAAPIYNTPIPQPTATPKPTPTSTPTSTASPTPTVTPAPSPYSTPSPNVTITPAPTPSLLPTPTPSPIPTPSPKSTFHVSTDRGAIVTLSLNGNITGSQMLNAIISVNTSATTTIVSFTLTGQSGTIGFSNVTIPKSEIPLGKIPTMYIDNKLAPNQGFSQDLTNYFVWYTTHFSTHKVSIVFSEHSGAGTEGHITLFEILVGAVAGAGVVTIIVAVVVLVTKSKNATVQ